MLTAFAKWSATVGTAASSAGVFSGTADVAMIPVGARWYPFTRGRENEVVKPFVAASVGPMFVGDKPRMTVVRFQGEGDGMLLAKLLKSGLDWTGPARSQAQPIK